MKHNWEMKRLSEVSEIVNGGTPKTGVSEYWNGKHLWITPAEMGKRQSPFVDNTERKLSDAGLKNSSAQLLPLNSVILSSRAPIGHLVINTKPMATNQGCKGIIPSPNLFFVYLYYYLYHNVDLLNSLGTGATFKELSGGKLKEIPIPLPPLPEQHRIVAILDKACAAIARAKENAEKNLANARELFESYLQGVFANPGDGWVEKKLEELCDLITCGVAATPQYVNETEGVPFLSAQNVRDGEVVLDKYRYISKQFHQELTKKNKPAKGDVLYSRVGSKFGEAGVVQHDFEFSVYVSLTLIKPKSEKLNNYYLKYYLNSPPIKSLAKKSISSSGVPNLNVKDVREFPIKCPSISIQKKTVNQIKILSAQTKKLESIYQQKLADLDELKKSILDKAFKGELPEVSL